MKRTLAIKFFFFVNFTTRKLKPRKPKRGNRVGDNQNLNKMWFLLERLFLIFLVLIFFTEFLIPLIMDKPLFGNFRKKKTSEPKPTGEPDVLKEKIVKAKEKVKEVKNVQDEVSDFHKKSKDLKDEADDLLK